MMRAWLILFASGLLGLPTITVRGFSPSPTLPIKLPTILPVNGVIGSSIRISSFLAVSRDDDDDDDEEEDKEESINPNDLETPDERRNRMDNVRKIQKSFYRQLQNQQQAEGSSTNDRTTTTAISDSCNTILKNVPLWRVQWTELPGYQNLLNCHVAHYTHMFHTILAGPKPWYFGHVFLPGGSENLDNPDYQLLSSEESNNKTKATYTGVLMQVADSRQLEDGRLVLVVQALERFQVIEATQHTPYAVATVQLCPDTELAMTYYDKAQSMARELSDDFLHDQDAWGAACAAALEAAEQLRQFEYRPVLVQSSTMGAVAPLVNYDMDVDVETVFPLDMDRAQAQKERVGTVMEKHLFSASPVDLPDNLKQLDLEQVGQLEHEVWLGVDELVKLLYQLNPNPTSPIVTPVPTQMLGLLPRGDCCSQQYIPWPGDFKLDQFANRLEDYAAAMPPTVGTYSKSPFVRYDYADNPLKRYPILRRAQRLSFVVWILMENIGPVGNQPVVSRQDILEMHSISERLEAARDRLKAINASLRRVADQQ